MNQALLRMKKLIESRRASRLSMSASKPKAPAPSPKKPEAPKAPEQPKAVQPAPEPEQPKDAQLGTEAPVTGMPAEEAIGSTLAEEASVEPEAPAEEAPAEEEAPKKRKNYYRPRKKS